MVISIEETENPKVQENSERKEVTIGPDYWYSSNTAWPGLMISISSSSMLQAINNFGSLIK